MPRAAPDPKMTSISAMPPDRSGTGRARGAEYSVFCTARAGVHQDQEEHPSFLCNQSWEVCKTSRGSIADVQIERAGQQRLHPAPKSSRAGTLLTNPHRQTNAARALSQNRLSEPRLTVRHEYLALVNQVTCQVGGLNLGSLELLWIDSERVLVQDYQVGVFAGF